MLLEHAQSTEILALERMRQARREARAARRGGRAHLRPTQDAGPAWPRIRGALLRAVVALAGSVRRHRTTHPGRARAHGAGDVHGRRPGTGTRAVHPVPLPAAPCPACP